MGRKHLLEHLIAPVAEAPPAAAPAPRARRPMGRGVGVIGAMSESIEAMEASVREAQEKLETGEMVVEIATDLIDPSFITDRIGVDADMDDFVASIREHGQRTPILLRPHPQQEGRYQIAFGHRRYRALKALGRPVKALIKPLTDEELVVAQGQENQSRLDLSYIERAIFAARLEARQFQRDIICSALTVDKTEVSRMISVATSLPDELIEAIGPAQTTGRRKWMELAKAVKALDWTAEREHVLAACHDAGSGSDGRFEAALRATASLQNAETGHPPRTAPPFTVERKPGVIRVRFDETTLPAQVVEECLARIREVCNSLGIKP